MPAAAETLGTPNDVSPRFDVLLDAPQVGTTSTRKR
jgi:hypothetical protein